MAIPVTVPRLGWTMDEGTFVEWLAADGTMIRPGDPLFVLENEKAAENIESLDAGILRIGPESPLPGATVRVGQVLAYLVSEGEAAPGIDRFLTAESPAPAKPVPVAAPVIDSPASRIAITPRARRFAREHGIEWAGITGTGRHGRIRERDIRTVVESTSAGKLVPNRRRTLAARMVAGVTQAAPVTLTTKADITELRDLRRNYAGSPMPSITDLILLAVARCLRDHPMLQAQWRDEHLFVPAGVHVALAVDSEHGLQVPVIRDADRLTLPEIVTQTRAAIGAARSSLLPVDATRGATFTITNLGMYGIDQFTPIIPLPQCAILGVGRIVREPALIEERIAIRDMMTLSLTFDHRIVDGAPAARFLDALRRELEQPRLHR